MSAGVGPTFRHGECVYLGQNLPFLKACGNYRTLQEVDFGSAREGNSGALVAYFTKGKSVSKRGVIPRGRDSNGFAQRRHFPKKLI